MPPESGVQKKKRAVVKIQRLWWNGLSGVLRLKMKNNKPVSYRDLKFKTTSPSKINNKKINYFMMNINAVQ